MVGAAFSLDEVRVATPCHASWNAMAGDDRVRHCGLCQKKVYNLSALSGAEAMDLIRAKEGDLCVRLHRRTDGTLLTGDCPVGVRALRRRAWTLTATAVGILLVIVGLMGAAAFSLRDEEGSRGVVFSPLQRLKQWFFPESPPRFRDEVMGKMCIPIDRPPRGEFREP